MVVGDKVETRVVQPDRPAGLRGEVIEVGPRFVVVVLENGRLGCYFSRQLKVVSAQETRG